jgi:flagellar M-ring protein FliF
MGGILLKLRTWWETADRTQKVVTIFGSAFLVALLFGTFYFAGRPKMELAYGGLEPAEQGRVVAEIQKLGIPVEFDLQGNVKVPHDKVAQVRSSLAASGSAPTSGHLGAADLGKIGLMSPAAVENAQLNSIREGQIAATLESLSGVSSAKVLLTMGNKGGFAADDDPPTASVTITEQPGTDLSGAPAKAMASLVAKAVPGLSSKNVSIVNQDGILLFDGAEAEGSNGLYTTKLTAQSAEARRIKRELQPLLDRFGVGNTVLSVRVEMDFNKQSQRKIENVPHETPISESSAVETMGGGASPNSGGVAGVASNGSPAFAEGGAGASGSGGYEGAQKEKIRAYDTITTETEKAPGELTSVAISVLVNEKSEPAIDTARVEEAIKGWLGQDKLETGKFNVAVTSAPFDPKPAQEATKAAGEAAGRERNQQLFSLLPIAALLVVAFMVIKALAKVAKSQNVMVQALPGGQLVALGGAPRSLTAGAAALPQGSADWEAVAEGADAAVAAPVRKRKKPQTPEEEEEEEQERIRVGRISEKVNVPLEQIKKMANDKPESIAMLLKSWMVEERR